MVKRRQQAARNVAQPKLGNSDKVTSTKRIRVSRACDQCRATRERCNGSAPCDSCASHHRQCSYEGPAKRRGVQPNYIRALELTLAWMFKTIPNAETTLLRRLASEDVLVSVLTSESGLQAASELQDIFRASSFHDQITRSLAGEPTISTNGQPANKPFRVHRDGEPALGDSTMAISKDATAEDAATALIKLPSNTWRLMDHFFAFTHSWLPIIEKDRMLRLVHEYPEEGLERSEMRNAEHVELWSVLALTASQLPYDSINQQAQRLRDVAENLIPAIGRNVSYQFPHLKAMMMLTLLDMTEDRILAAWLRIGTVVSLLMLFPLLEKIGASTKKCRHIHLAAFVLEQAIASHLRIPTHARTKFIEAMGLVDEDGIDEWLPWSDPLNFDNHSRPPPMKAHSTLNELVRIALRSSDQSTNQSVGGNADIAVVSSLLKNAITSKTERLQPYVLLSSHIDKSGPG